MIKPDLREKLNKRLERISKYKHISDIALYKRYLDKFKKPKHDEKLDQPKNKNI